MSKDGAAKDPTREGLGDILFDAKEKAKVDIVFVHGLGGHRVDTWTWKNDDWSQFWPKTLLPKDCPTSRIMSFGYNADFAHFYPSSSQTISPELTLDNYSTSLFQALIGLRDKTESKDRRIIFVAHSLGGLVVANALSRPHGTDASMKGIADNTIGALFLGTPFGGSSKALYGNIAVNLLSFFTSTQKANLNDLMERSEKLTSINDAFAKFLKERDRSRTKPHLEIACFFEERSLRKGRVKIGIIVPKESASWLGVDALSIPKDHIEMCKFDDEEASDYRSVAAKLRQWIADSDKSREADRGGVGGVNAQSIGVYQGNVDYRGATGNHVMVGNIHSTATKGAEITGTANYHYAAGTKPPE